MANDNLLSDTSWWPHVKAGDDIGGSQRLHFFVKGKDGRYHNLAPLLGLDDPVPTRGIATGDADGDGRIDFAVARQWDEPVFYRNESPSKGAFLGLRLHHPAAGAATTGAATTGAATTGAATAGAATAGEPAAGAAAQAGAAAPAAGSPVVGAQVRVTTADGRVLLGRVDGGSGHSGKRSQDVHIGLGEDVTGPVLVSLSWRDRTGQVHEQDLRLTPGWHTFELGAQALER
jgi:hypothetical protein